MIEQKLKILSFLLLIFFLACAKEIAAQEAADHLVISQVCLNNNEKPQSWIEIFNPTDKTLILERFRLSHLRTFNALPDSINKEGGIKVSAGEYIILCADKNIFKSTYGNQVKAIWVKSLSLFAAGGFLAITTKGVNATKGEVVRYGKGEYSSGLAKVAGEQVIGFSDKGRSYTRKIKRGGTGITVSDFVESSANPGNSNN